MQVNAESSQRVNSSTNIRFDENRAREISQGAEPSTDNITNAMAEGTHGENMTSGLANLTEQHTTRVSELSIIDVNDPLPHSPLDYNPERKNLDGKLQETKQQYTNRHGQVQESVRGRDNWQQHQGRYSGTKGSRHNEVTGLMRKQTYGGQERDNSHEKTGPSQYYNKRRKDLVSGSVGQRNFGGNKQQQDTTLN